MNIKAWKEVPGIQLIIKSYPTAQKQQTMPVEIKEESPGMVVLHKEKGYRESK
jgi:hypothetical protein